jgi:heme oxygenase (biliverdin-IX-beta and delta-forming)
MPTAVAPSELSTNPARACPPAVGLRDRLRSATAAAHARLDAQLGAHSLQDLAGYRRFLEANAAALLPLENALVAAGVAQIFPDWELRSRRRAILDDLVRVDGKARPLPAPAPLDLGGMLGTMYVLEGSRLGAKVLLRAIAQSADPVVTNATAYLRHGAGRQLWPSFLAVLEHHAATLPGEASAVDGALTAFDWFADAAARIGRPGAQAHTAPAPA